MPKIVSVNYRGREYRSLAEVHRVHGAPDINYRAFMQRYTGGWTLDDALKLSPNAKQAKVTYEGKTYKNITDLYRACAPEYVSLETFRMRYWKGWSLERALFEKPRQKSSKNYRYNGKIYSNLRQLYDEFTEGTVGFRAFRSRVLRGWSIAKALTRPTDSDENDTIYKGKRYASKKRLYQDKAIEGVSFNAFKSRLANGWNIEEALKTPSDFTNESIKLTVDGRQFDSLASLARHYHVHYVTARGRFNKNWSPNEIAYGRNKFVKRKNKPSKGSAGRRDRAKKRSNNPIIFQGTEYRSTTELCRVFSVNRRTFSGRLKVPATTVEQALGLAPTNKQLERQIEYAGKIYPSKQALIDEYGVKKWTFFDRLKRGCTVLQALGIESVPPRTRRKVRKSRKREKKPRRIGITVAGRRYSTKKECANAHGMSPQKLNYRISMGWTPEEAVGISERADGRMKSIKCHGTEYSSIKEFADHFDMRPGLVENRLLSGYTPEEAVGLQTRSSRASARSGRSIIIDGNSYDSIDDACANLGVPRGTVEHRRARGMSFEQAFSTDPKLSRYSFEFNGRVFRSRTELANEFGLAKSVIDSRIRRGWSIAESVGLVDRQKPDRFGVYSGKYFSRHPQQKNVPAILYLVKLTDKNSEDSFYKIGITIRAVRGRFNEIKSLFKCRTVKTVSLRLFDAWKQEQRLLRKYRNHRVTREKIKLGGRTECFDFDSAQVREIRNAMNTIK